MKISNIDRDKFLIGNRYYRVVDKYIAKEKTYYCFRTISQNKNK